jgi:tripartite motif-containing protein 71
MAQKRGPKSMICKGIVRQALGMVMIMFVLSLFLPSVGQAMPAVQQLAGITDGAVLQSPGRLAAGGDGTLYVADSAKNRILKFNRSGTYIGDIPFPNASAIAVAPNGTLYVGSNIDYSVSIVRNGTVAGTLGIGKNEFRSVRDIAVDSSTGLIYVADNVGNAVRIFNANGVAIGSISGVNLPAAIEVTADAIYVIDAPVVPEGAEKTTGSRISVFDKSYAFVREIADYGRSLMFNPTDIAVADGILYVADPALKAVILYDTSGAYIGEISQSKSALSLSLSSDGILYVSSNETRNIMSYAITAQTSGLQGE